MPITTCFSTAYLPPIEYVSALLKADRIEIEQWEHYQKQSYRNRAHIAAANGLMSLSIPVEHVTGQKRLTKDIRISKHSDWQRQHWVSLVSAYKTTPYFDYYQEDFAPFFEKKWEFLLDFNMVLLHKVLELLDTQKEIRFTTEYRVLCPTEVVDLRTEFHPKKESGTTPKPYYQVFDQKHGFIPHTSIIDLLFNMGNEAPLWLV